MRRRPDENVEVYSTNVFSNDAWSSSNQSSPVESEEIVDLSKYAAKSLPINFSSTAQTARYAPSAHSSQYEPSPNLTNSQQDPFQHAAYDGSTAAPIAQNARVEDMPSPLRKRQLGLSNNDTFTAPQPIAPQIPINQTPTITPEQAPINHGVAQPPAPTIPSHQVPAPAPAPAQMQAPNPTPAPTPATPHENVEPEIPLADFEKEFIEVKKDNSHDEVLDLTQDQHPQSIAPSLFTSPSPISQVPPTAPLAYEPIAYNTADSVFGTQHLDISDEDRLYKDPREPRETIQIDLDFLRNIASKISLKVAAIILVVLIVLVGAYIFTRPSSNENLPSNAEPIVESQSLTPEKTVVDPSVQVPTDSAPQIPAPQDQVYVDPGLSPDNAPSNQGPGAILTYDENGNAVYTSPTNQNFNGD